MGLASTGVLAYQATTVTPGAHYRPSNAVTPAYPYVTLELIDVTWINNVVPDLYNGASFTFEQTKCATVSFAQRDYYVLNDPERPDRLYFYLSIDCSNATIRFQGWNLFTAHPLGCRSGAPYKEITFDPNSALIQKVENAFIRVFCPAAPASSSNNAPTAPAAVAAAAAAAAVEPATSACTGVTTTGAPRGLHAAVDGVVSDAGGGGGGATGSTDKAAIAIGVGVGVTGTLILLVLVAAAWRFMHNKAQKVAQEEDRKVAGQEQQQQHTVAV